MGKVIIIGGGASGMTAAISAARHGAEAVILEHTDRVGKKLLSTGNGKCNYTNLRQGLRHYRGESPAFVLPVFEQFGLEETIAFFKELGIFPTERNGCLYPASGQASSVLDVLRMELRRLGVSVLTERSLSSVRASSGGISVGTGQGEVLGDCCIFCCGGKSFPKSGSDGSAYPYIEKLGHTIIDVVPALTAMKARQAFFPSIAGIRADISIQLYIDGRMACEDRGEVQIAEYGVSGIPAFQVSRYAARALKEKKKVWAVLDVVPYLSKQELERELMRRFSWESEKTCEEALIGLFPKKMIPMLLKESRIPLHEKAGSLGKKRIHDFSAYLKRVKIDITGTMGFEKAQACAGGVSVKEIDAHTLESLLCPRIYFAGEVIDIDGVCGGYNLQWAWSSGMVAGMHAAVKASQERDR